MGSVDGRKSTIQVGGLKTVLKAAQRLDTSCCKRPMGKGQQPKSAFIQTVQIVVLKACVLLF